MVAVDESTPVISGEAASPQTAETEQAALVAVLFKKGFNKAKNEEQIKASFRTVREDGTPLFVTVVKDVDAEQTPGDGEVWVVEARKEPIASWNHRNADGSVMPSILVFCIPLMRIEIPDVLRFGDLSPKGSPCCVMPNRLPDGTRLAFVADRRRIAVCCGARWKVKASHVVQHDLGEDQTVVIAVACIEEVIAQPVLPLSAAFASAKVWRPGQKAQLHVA